MTLFQVIVLPTLVLFMALDVRGVFARRGNASVRLTRIAAWLVAACLVFSPGITSQFARALGIGRGVDLVFYLFMLAAPIVWFRMQTQIHSVQRRVVELARIEAIRGAVHGQDEMGDTPHHTGTE